MAQYTSAADGWTAAAIADAASLTNSNHQSLRCWSSTVAARVIEVFIGGEATSSTVNRMTVRRHSTQGATPTNTVPAQLNPFSPAARITGFVLCASTQPVVQAGHLANLAFNAFGGIIRWVAAPGEEMYITGTIAANNEVSITSLSGVGVVSTHFVFEEL